MAVNFSKWSKKINTHLPWILVIILITTESQMSGSNFTSSLLYSDKAVHLIIFGLLGWLMARAIFQENNLFLHKNYFWVVLICIAFFAILDEIHQLYIPGRSFDMLDWAADLSGACLFLLLFKKRHKI